MISGDVSAVVEANMATDPEAAMSSFSKWYSNGNVWI